MKVTRRQLRKLILESLEEKQFIAKLAMLFQAGEFAQAADLAEALGIPLRKLPWKVFYGPGGWKLFTNLDNDALLDLADIVIKVLEPESKAEPPTFSSADLAKDIQLLRNYMQELKSGIKHVLTNPNQTSSGYFARRNIETVLSVMVRHRL